MALLILALLQRIFLMSSLMLLLVWLIFFMVLYQLLPILGTISGKTVKRSEERFSRNAETELVCRLLLEKKNRVHVVDEKDAACHRTRSEGTCDVAAAGGEAKAPLAPGLPWPA